MISSWFNTKTQFGVDSETPTMEVNQCKPTDSLAMFGTHISLQGKLQTLNMQVISFGHEALNHIRIYS